jgi:CRP-like cAMP-binding protein
VKASDLKRFDLFVEFSEEDRANFFELLDEQSVAAGETLFCAGDEADSLVLVLSGSFRVKSLAGGSLGLLCEGTHLGALSLMTIGCREATACAQADARVAMLSRAGFLRLADDFPRTACRLAEAIIADFATAMRPQLSRISEGLSTDDIVVSG